MVFGTQFQMTPREILMKFDDDNLRTFEVICKRDLKMTSANFLVTPVPGTPHVDCRILHLKLFSIMTSGVGQAGSVASVHYEI